MKKYYYILLFAINFNANAQLDKTIPELTKPNPEVASLGKYGELPMNYYSGTANIDVPLHEIDFDGLKIPIALSYSTGGISARQEASWVGLGWGLSAEPVITRNTRGLDDVTQVGANVGFPYTRYALPEFSYNFSYASPLWEELGVHEDYNNIVNTYDTEPDIFTVNLFGESAKFILTQKNLNGGVIGTVMINADSRIRVVYNESAKTFTVTNDRGFVFYFTNPEYSVTAVERQIANDFAVLSGFDNPMITGWKIEKIVSPKGNTLYYNYYERATIKDQPIASEKGHNLVCPNLDNFAPWGGYISSYIRPSRSLNCHAALYLASIVYDDFRVDFVGSDRLDLMDGNNGRYPIVTSIANYRNEKPKKLDHIYVKDLKNQTVKDFQFGYSYFNANATFNSQFTQEYLRLKLDNIFENGEMLRRFEYLNPDQLPNKLTKSTDYWGYYNGKTNEHLYPSYKALKNCLSTPTMVSIIAADKSPDFNFGKNGLLTKIYYPTKGYSEITYEPHSILLNSQTKNTNVPFEDVEVFQAESYDESSPGNSAVFTLNGTPVDYAWKKESGVGAPPSSIFGHIVLEISCGSGFVPGGGTESYRKCTVLDVDAWKPALQIINASNNQVVLTRRFSSDIVCNLLCPPLSINNGVTVINIPLSDLPAGSYYFRVTALKHISNLLDAEEGFQPGNPDYMKQYYFPVRAKVKIPKSSIYANYNKEIGGARVKKITNYNYDATITDKKEYKYLTALPSSSELYSSGILMDVLDFANDYSYGTDDFLCPNGNSCASGCSVRNVTVYSENRRNQYAPSQAHVGYSRIEEIYSANTGIETNGKTVYHYSANKNESVFYSSVSSHMIYRPNNPIYDNLNLALSPKRTYEESNGDLLKTEHFDALGNLKRREENTYMYHDYYPPRKVGIGMHVKFHLNYSFACIASNPTVRGTIENMQIYEIKDEVTPVLQKKTTEYFSNGQLEKTISYEYNNKYQPSVITETTSESGANKIIKNYYPGDAEIASFPYTSELVSKNIIGSPLRSKQYSGAELLEQVDKEYGLFNGSLLAEASIKTLKGGNTIVPQTEFNLERYDEKGNLLQYKKANSIPISLIWGYKKTLPIAKIENLAYNTIPASTITNLQQKSDTGTEADLLLALDALRIAFPDALVTAFTYKPGIGISTKMDSKGNKASYYYDNKGRLWQVRDRDNNILSENEYHYKP